MYVFFLKFIHLRERENENFLQDYYYLFLLHFKCKTIFSLQFFNPKNNLQHTKLNLMFHIRNNLTLQLFTKKHFFLCVRLITFKSNFSDNCIAS